MPLTKDITVRFCLTKGDGPFIERSKFSDEEMDDIRNCLSLLLTYRRRNESCASIVSIQVIYDGITSVEDEPQGYRIDRESEYPLDGYPAPIVRFQLDRAMDEEEFLQCVEETSYRVLTKLMERTDEQPHFAEDYNGYLAVLTAKERDQAAIILELNGAYSGKVFQFPNGLPENGHLIPAMEFAVKPFAI